MFNHVGPAAGINLRPPVAFHRDGLRRHTVQKIPVVADQKDGAVIIAQHVLQQVQRLDIQVVRRFIQNQKVRWHRHDPGQQKPRLLAP